MRLTLEILKSADPDHAVGTELDLDSDESHELTFGRSPRNSFRMVEDKHISKRHARVYCEEGNFFLADDSTNGSLLNQEVLKGEARKLSDGDRIAIGPYEFRVNIEEAIRMPFDIFDEEEEERPPSLPGSDDEEIIDLWGGSNEVRKSPPAPAWPPRHPLSDGPESNVVLPPFPKFEPDENQTKTPLFNPTDFDPSQSGDCHEEPVFVETIQEKQNDNQTRPDFPRVPRPVPPPPSAAPAPETGASAKCWEAFLRGAQIDDEDLPAVADHVAHFERMGQLFQLFVSGNLQLMKARDAVRNHFGMENTIFHSEANNPLKNTNNVESAIVNLLRPRAAKGYMQSEKAVAEAMRALAHHEHALIAATVDGLDSLFEPLRPGNFESKKGAGPAAWFAAAGARGRAWDGFCLQYERYVGNRAYMDRYREQFSKTYEDELEARKHQSHVDEDRPPASSRKQSKKR